MSDSNTPGRDSVRHEGTAKVSCIYAITDSSGNAKKHIWQCPVINDAMLASTVITKPLDRRQIG